LVRRIIHPQRRLGGKAGDYHRRLLTFTAGTQIHGFPDLSIGWRYQIPHILKLGFRVIAPDCIGYGRSVSELYFQLVIERCPCGLIHISRMHQKTLSSLTRSSCKPSFSTNSAHSLAARTS
jgi:pimeloyl-ACP methyl ester carboxylesterase